MKKEKQVVSLKYSKELEKLGVKQESLWMWVKYELWKEPRLWQSDLATDVKVTCLSGKREYAYSAFTCAELGKKLPFGIRSYKTYHGNWFVCEVHQNCKFIDKLPKTQETIDDEGYKGWFRLGAMGAKTEADCRAKMLIYLIKNKLINLTK